MSSLIDRTLAALDKRMEKTARRAARLNGRRSFLARTGGMLVGVMAMPLLPFDRGAGLAHAASAGKGVNDPLSCDYWRYCALDGNLCAASGGTQTSCPPGSEASKVTWVGTCHNPNDGKDYLVSYNDCCGKAQVAGSVSCLRSEGERPGYRMGLYNDINWCMANDNKGYHCTVALLAGQVDA